MYTRPPAVRLEKPFTKPCIIMGALLGPVAPAAANPTKPSVPFVVFTLPTDPLENNFTGSKKETCPDT